MKAEHTAEYWNANWDNMLTDKHDKHYMNLEEDLDHEVECLIGVIPESEIQKAKKVFANMIIPKAEAVCKEMMETVKRYKAGKCSFGYTTHKQEIHAWNAFRMRFEFNCYQLSVFRKKYA